MLFLLVIFQLWLVDAQCNRDSYTSLPPLPGFPSTTYTGSVDASNTYVQNHWSQVVTLPRPTNNIVSTQTNCPHLGADLQDWHTASTWGGVVPANNSAVVIPANTKVLISSCSIPASYIFANVTVPATSSLIFGDAVISFQTKAMKVLGNLQIGSPTCRLRNKINITLYGSKAAQPFGDPTVKGIHVTGSVDMHGAEYFPTWTRLAKTAKIGDSVIFIQDCPNWQVGQRIVITTTELKDTRDWHRNEEALIQAIQRTSISASVCAITLTAPLQYTHYGGFEYQAEVALLSRNILFQGDASSEPSDTQRVSCTQSGSPSTYPCSDQFLTGFGAHLMIAHGATAGRISGVEGYRVGQTNQLGRYPFHFHMIGNITIPNMYYFSDNSVRHSFFRCFTIHGTSGTNLANGVLVTKNTGYDVIGHCFFMSEDGMEENHTISYNFAAHVHVLGPFWQTSYGISVGAEVQPNGGSFFSQMTDWVTANPNLVLADDISASPYYFSNSYSVIIGNAASGGWAGFAFPNLNAPVGASYTKTHFVPKNRPIIKFQGNSAHSTGFWQSHAAGVYLGGELQIVQAPTGSTTGTKYTSGRATSRDTCLDSTYGSPSNSGGCPADKRVWLKFEDTKVFLANVGLQSWGDREEIIRFEVHDCGLSTNVFGWVWVDQMLVNGRTAHRPTYLSGCTTSQWWTCNYRDLTWWQSFLGFQFYDTGQSHIVTNSIFSNFQPSGTFCINNGNCDEQIWSYLTHSDQFTPGLMQMTKNITYINVNMNNLMKPTTRATDKVTVSGRDASWFDADGTVNQLFRGRRTNIGSNWTGPDWWRYNNECINTQHNWVCPMDDRDDKVSMMVHWDKNLETMIGRPAAQGGVCSNGGPYSPCPFGAKVTHFGRSEANGFDVSAMPRVTGPLIASAGGWFIRYTAGTPRLISFDELQIAHSAVMHVAIPYPAGTTFRIWAQAPFWCVDNKGTDPWDPICEHYFRQVNSVQAVRDAWGDAYYFDNQKQLLHLRLVQFDNFGYAFATNSNAAANTNWTSTSTSSHYFSRGGLNLITSGSYFWSVQVQVTSSNCNPACPPLPDVSVPLELFPGTPTTPPIPVPVPRAPVPVPVAPVPVPVAPVPVPVAPVPVPVAPVPVPRAPVPVPVAPVPVPVAPVPVPVAPVPVPRAPVPVPVAPVPVPVAPVPVPRAPVPVPVAPVPVPVAPVPVPVAPAPVPVPVAPVPVPVAPVPVPVAPVPVPRAPVPVPVAPVPVPVAPVPVPVAPVPVPVAPIPVPRAPVPAPVTPVPAPIASTGGYRALGCGVDSSTRALNSASTTNSAMTHVMCYNFCKSRGFPVFGTEYGTECYCGTVPFSQGQVPFSECNVACAGDSLQPCGGPWRLSVFQAYTCTSGARLDDDTSTASDGQLSSGQIAGIIVGSVVGTLLFVGAAVAAWIKVKAHKTERV